MIKNVFFFTSIYAATFMNLYNCVPEIENVHKIEDLNQQKASWWTCFKHVSAHMGTKHLTNRHSIQD